MTGPFKFGSGKDDLKRLAKVEDAKGPSKKAGPESGKAFAGFRWFWNYGRRQLGNLFRYKSHQESQEQLANMSMSCFRQSPPLQGLLSPGCSHKVYTNTSEGARCTTNCWAGGMQEKAHCPNTPSTSSRIHIAHEQRTTLGNISSLDYCQGPRPEMAWVDFLEPDLFLLALYISVCVYLQIQVGLYAKCLWKSIYWTLMINFLQIPPYRWA